jgi:hypothetical protein
MALRNGHGNGRGQPRVEVLPVDELPAPVSAATTPPDVALAFRQDGKIADSETAREMGRRGGAAKARRVRLIDSLGLSKLVEATAFGPYRVAAEASRSPKAPRNGKRPAPPNITPQSRPSLASTDRIERARRDPQLADTQVAHACVEHGAEDGIAISDQAHRHDVRTDGLHHLLGRPCRVRVRRHIDVQHTAALEREDEEDVHDVERDRRHRQKSGSPGGYPPGPPRIRTCATRASGSSEVGFATCTGGRCAAAAEGTSSTADSSATS